jgi:D-alanyl-D-alanine dipeptidase
MTEAIRSVLHAPEIIPINHPDILAVPVHENHEPLVVVDHPRIKKPSEIATAVDLEDGSMMARAAVAKALIGAVESLPEEYGVVFIEGSRTFTQQQELFDGEVKRFMRKLGAGATEANAAKMAETFVANPAKYAPHVTGAAVDVALIKKTMADHGEVWNLVDMGSDGFSRTETAATDYPGLTHEQKQNRMLLKTTMEKAGFTNYPAEFWHYSMGDRYDAFRKGATAVYGEIHT